MQENEKVEIQPLVQPIMLKLTPQEQIGAMSHSCLLRQNGFKLESEPQLRLVGMPNIKGITFGKEDFEELLHKLNNQGSSKTICSRLERLYASKACRSAIMIGQTLQLKEMEKIVHHMAEMDQPWFDCTLY
ncbi:MutL C terminal dimerization domain-containing protein [Cladochytrium replicatum]|nr:MutL C terminal dimerization domain-containing protein [Cladochytrium replicatum]